MLVKDLILNYAIRGGVVISIVGVVKSVVQGHARVTNVVSTKYQMYGDNIKNQGCRLPVPFVWYEPFLFSISHILALCHNFPRSVISDNDII